ncbi:sugar transferase [Bacteroides ovatus]|nr:sugar transferase [Bacteroides ovatus]MCS2583471.1 sugar transferase [Bacteroides sp. BFG-551]UVP13559.1 sugar transferase [Bacteroides ovatus]UVP79713.1 sugar transferase [Bacteroides ovatus]
MYIVCIKRPIGFLGALVGLTLLSPIFLVTIILLFFANKNGWKGVFFTQERPGKNEKIFKALKFKTMTDERDASGNLLPDADRLTRVGKFIRSTSIDELPQLINILKGDMAFIGPRPLLVKYLPLYSEEQHHRHDVTPGMSGWAQVNGRNNISWTKKFELDVYYVNHIGLVMDVKVFFTTIKKVLFREGINTTTGQSATMDYFDGTN